jgi:hypothetical protein
MESIRSLNLDHREASLIFTSKFPLGDDVNTREQLRVNPPRELPLGEEFLGKLTTAPASR